MLRTTTLSLTLAFASCQADEPPTDTGDPTPGTLFGGDADTDADADSDTDADSDADTDTDANGLYFDATRVLVMPDGEGVKLVANDRAVTSEATWTEMIGSCASCGGEGATPDDDGGLILSYTLSGGIGTGGVARLTGGTGALDFRIDGFGFPHDAWRDPLDGTIVVQETSGGRLTWIAGDGSSDDTVRELTAQTNSDWPGNSPNGLYRFHYRGGTYLLSSHRGGMAGGEITMWDISTTTPAFVWRFPEEGADLDTPHCPRMRWFDGQWWLVWAHTEGADSDGSVGIASAADPLVRPTYVADLVPPSPIGPLDFLRGVELTTDGVLYLTDSGGQGGPGAGGGGRLIAVPMPTGLAPTGATGDVGVDQNLVDLPGGEVWLEDLDNPFEAWLWTPTFSL